MGMELEDVDAVRPRGVSRAFRRPAIGAVTVALMVGLVTACGGSSASTSSSTGSTTAKGSPKTGGVLRLASTWASASETLDPQTPLAGNDSTLNSQIYERLVRYDDDFNLTPELATKWESSADAKDWTFHLRPNVKFSDGSPFTSKDVAATIERVLNPKTGSSAMSSVAAGLDAKGIEIVDDVTITFHLKTPNAVFPEVLGQRSVAIAKAGTADSKQPVGTGPFMVKSWTPGANWEIVRNPNYWEKGLPYLDGVRYVNGSDPTQLLQSVQSGTADLAGYIAYAQVPQAESSGVKLVQAKASAYMYTVMDPRQKPWNDPRVIKAFKLAVDRQAVINASVQGSQPTSDVLSTPGSRFYPPDLGVREQNIDEAKQLLSEAGYPNGIDAELAVTDLTAGMTDFAAAMKEVVAPAGFRLAIKQFDTNAFLSKVWQKAPLYVMYAAARPPLLAMDLLYTKGAPWSEGFQNEQLDQLVQQAYRTVNAGARTKLIQQAFAILADEGNESVPVSLTQAWAAKKNLEGVEPGGEDTLRLKRAYFG